MNNKKIHIVDTTMRDGSHAVSHSYTREQVRLFCEVLKQVKEQGGVEFSIRHCANTGAVEKYPEMCLDMVRPGLLLYGYGDEAGRLGLKHEVFDLFYHGVPSEHIFLIGFFHGIRSSFPVPPFQCRDDAFKAGGIFPLAPCAFISDADLVIPCTIE